MISAMTSLAPLVSGILIGAASGIGGAVAGAWINGKSQLSALKLNISAEDKRAKITEKRRLYAQFTARVTELTDSIYDFSRPDGKSDKKIESERHRLDLADVSLRHVVNEVGLIAPVDLAEMVGETYDRLVKLKNTALEGMRNIKVPDHELDDLAQEIIVKMRKDIDTD
jgi:hypothetical protein